MPPELLQYADLLNTLQPYASTGYALWQCCLDGRDYRPLHGGRLHELRRDVRNMIRRGDVLSTFIAVWTVGRLWARLEAAANKDGA